LIEPVLFLACDEVGDPEVQFGLRFRVDGFELFGGFEVGQQGQQVELGIVQRLGVVPTPASSFRHFGSLLHRNKSINNKTAWIWIMSYQGFPVGICLTYMF
jgi:hypothetical protein